MESLRRKDPSLPTGWPAIVAAAYENEADAVQWLLEARSDPNQLAPSKASALWQAVTNSNERMVGILLNAKADPNHRKKSAKGSWRTVLDLAVGQGSPDTICRLLETWGGTSHRGLNPNHWNPAESREAPETLAAESGSLLSKDSAEPPTQVANHPYPSDVIDLEEAETTAQPTVTADDADLPSWRPRLLGHVQTGAGGHPSDSEAPRGLKRSASDIEPSLQAGRALAAKSAFKNTYSRQLLSLHDEKPVLNFTHYSQSGGPTTRSYAGLPVSGVRGSNQEVERLRAGLAVDLKRQSMHEGHSSSSRDRLSADVLKDPWGCSMAAFDVDDGDDSNNLVRSRTNHGAGIAQSFPMRRPQQPRFPPPQHMCSEATPSHPSRLAQKQAIPHGETQGAEQNCTTAPRPVPVKAAPARAPVPIKAAPSLRKASQPLAPISTAPAGIDALHCTVVQDVEAAVCTSVHDAGFGACPSEQDVKSAASGTDETASAHAPAFPSGTSKGEDVACSLPSAVESKDAAVLEELETGDLPKTECAQTDKNVTLNAATALGATLRATDIAKEIQASLLDQLKHLPRIAELGETVPGEEDGGPPPDPEGFGGTLLEIASKGNFSVGHNSNTKMPASIGTALVMLMPSPTKQRDVGHMWDDSKLTETQTSIIKELAGGSRFLDPTRDARAVMDQARNTCLVDVRQLKFCHSTISPVFKHGQHHNRPVLSLLADLHAGKADPKDLPAMVVMRSKRGMQVLCGNRRLYCLKRYSAEASRAVNAWCIVYDLKAQETPRALVMKYILAATTEDAGSIILRDF